MKFVTKLDFKQTRELVHNGRIENICIIPINKDFQGLLTRYLEDNTGFSNIPVMGITKIMGEEGLEEIWDDISNLISIQVNDVLLEFDMPSDMIATVGYSNLLEINKSIDLDINDLEDVLKIEEHTDDENELAFTSLLMFEYCTGYKIIGSNWEQENCKMEPVSSLKGLNIFGGN